MKYYVENYIQEERFEEVGEGNYKSNELRKMFHTIAGDIKPPGNYFISTSWNLEAADEYFSPDYLKSETRAMIFDLTDKMSIHVCPECKGEKCDFCKGNGYVVFTSSDNLKVIPKMKY